MLFIYLFFHLQLLVFLHLLTFMIGCCQRSHYVNANLVFGSCFKNTTLPHLVHIAAFVICVQFVRTFGWSFASLPFILSSSFYSFCARLQHIEDVVRD